jgi:hypothetical protein
LFYFELLYERFEEERLALKQWLVRVVKLWASRGGQFEFDVPEAAYQLSVCHVNGFGAEPDVNEGLKWVVLRFAAPVMFVVLGGLRGKRMLTTGTDMTIEK